MDTQVWVAVQEVAHRIRVAVGFLTALPVGRLEFREGDLARASAFFPLVGLGIGLANFATWKLGQAMTDNRWMAALGVVLAWTMLTRAFHLDGAADICDAVIGGATPERRRVILADPRLGTYGVVAIFFLLAGKMVMISSLDRAFPLVMAPVIGRTAALFMGALFPALPSGSKGLGSQITGKIPLWYSWLWMAVVMSFGIGQDPWVLLKTAGTFIMIFLFGRLLVRTLEGVNGDGLGAGIEWAESITLLLR